MADVGAQAHPPALGKKKEKRRNKDNQEVAAEQRGNIAAQEQPVRPGTTEGDDRSFQPGGSFAVRDDTCALELSGEDTELCLLQLPHSWPMAGGGVILLDPRGNVGSCTDNNGQEYHVLQDSCAPSLQIYLAAPGKKMRPKPIARRFTLVRADHLPTLLSNQRQAALASDAQEPQVEKKPKKKKKRKENGDTAQLVPCNTETATGNKRSVQDDDGKVNIEDKAARKARKEGKKKRKKEREENEHLITN